MPGREKSELSRDGGNVEGAANVGVRRAASRAERPSAERANRVGAGLAESLDSSTG